VEPAENSDVIRFTAGATRTVSPEVEAFAEQKSLPHSTHRTQIIAAAAAGKHVYCEKPFTLTKREAEDTVSAVRHARVTLAVPPRYA
jgi:Oxidoreductase family, NAD-binding Rossmann fold